MGEMVMLAWTELLLEYIPPSLARLLMNPPFWMSPHPPPSLFVALLVLLTIPLLTNVPPTINPPPTWMYRQWTPPTISSFNKQFPPQPCHRQTCQSTISLRPLMMVPTLNAMPPIITIVTLTHVCNIDKPSWHWQACSRLCCCWCMHCQQLHHQQTWQKQLQQ